MVDYKSSKGEFEKDRQQVGEYLGLVRQLYPGLKVSGYLIYLDNLDLAEI